MYVPTLLMERSRNPLGVIHVLRITSFYPLPGSGSGITLFEGEFQNFNRGFSLYFEHGFPL